MCWRSETQAMKFKSTLDEIVEETKCPTCGPSSLPFHLYPPNLPTFAPLCTRGAQGSASVHAAELHTPILTAQAPRGRLSVLTEKTAHSR